MKAPLPVFLALVLFANAPLRAATAAYKSKNIVLDEVVFHDAPLRECIVWLRRRSVEEDSSELNTGIKGIEFALNLNNPAPLSHHPGEAPVARKVTLSLTHVTLSKAVDAICKSAGVKAVYIGPGILFEPLSGPDKPDDSTVLGNVVNVSDAEEVGEEVTAKKLHGIIIPKVAFQNATASLCIQWLRLRSAELDTEPDPFRRGIQIIVMGELSNKEPPEKADISFALSNVPFAEALGEFAQRAGYKMYVTRVGVILRPTR